MLDLTGETLSRGGGTAGAGSEGSENPTLPVRPPPLLACADAAAASANPTDTFAGGGAVGVLPPRFSSLAASFCVAARSSASIACERI